MMRRKAVRFTWLVALVALVSGIGVPAAGAVPAGGPGPREPFELRDGDRVVFLGSTLVERAQAYGYVELALTTRWPDRDITFRNLGWSGDTVHGEARGYFTRPPSPFERLIEQVKAVRPTVIFVGYGANEAQEGEAALPRFVEGLDRLLDHLEETGARIVLLSPVPHEAQRSPVPDVSVFNEPLRRITGVIAETASRRGLRFIDLFTPLDALAARGDVALTSNGVHLDEGGYYYLASVIEQGLGLPPRTWKVSVDARAGRAEAVGATVSGWAAEADGGLRFTVRDAALPLPAPSSLPASLARSLYERTLVVRGLPGGRYTLTVGSTAVATATAEAWAQGVPLGQGPEHEQAERLRRAILDKDYLFFQQYRPPNNTYILGFRKYEQGRHAEELEQITPLIDERENEIGRLRVPVPRRYRLVPAQETTSGL